MKLFLFLVCISILLKPEFYPDYYKKSEFEKVWSLYGENESAQFYDVQKICVDSEESVYILDGYDQNIKKFDKNGNYKITIGRKGKGPGEFEVCRDAQIDGKNNIVVLDDYNKRFTWF